MFSLCAWKREAAANIKSYGKNMKKWCNWDGISRTQNTCFTGIVLSTSPSTSTTYLNSFERGVSEAWSLMSIGLSLVLHVPNVGQTQKGEDLAQRNVKRQDNSTSSRRPSLWSSASPALHSSVISSSLTPCPNKNNKNNKQQKQPTTNNKNKSESSLPLYQQQKPERNACSPRRTERPSLIAFQAFSWKGVCESAARSEALGTTLHISTHHQPNNTFNFQPKKELFRGHGQMNRKAFRDIPRLEQQ